MRGLPGVIIWDVSGENNDTLSLQSESESVHTHTHTHYYIIIITILTVYQNILSFWQTGKVN